MSRFLLNAAVLTRAGTYAYRHVTLNEARTWLQRPYVSRLRYSATADALRTVLDVPVALDRTPLEMRIGDEALVFRLTFDWEREMRRERGLGVTNAEALTAEFIARNCEVGILTRLK